MLKFLPSMLCTSKIHPFSLGNHDVLEGGNLTSMFGGTQIKQLG